MVGLYRGFGFLYFMSGIWCAIQLDLAAGFLGFNFLDKSAESEFFTVYGGLQIGLGLAILVSSFKPSYLEASVFFTMIFSSLLVLFRTLSFVLYGLSSDFVSMFFLELGIALGLIWIWSKTNKVEG